VQWAGPWTYVILALIIFCETGLVVTPFLPGDSLLFATGALAAATSSLSITALFLLLTVCAIGGDAVNYFLGSIFGERASAGKLPLVRKAHIDRTHAFFTRHGGKTIFLARFVPIVRTFAPFVAGAGAMTYKRFAAYNVVGGIVWVGSMLYAGYFFGNLPFVRDNFSVVILGIIFVSILPGVVAVLQERSRVRA
jgi:membrane-associated protein